MNAVIVAGIEHRLRVGRAGQRGAQLLAGCLRQRRLPTWQLFAIAVAIWGTTWHAILYQLAHTPPEAGVALRFAIAGVLGAGRGAPGAASASTAARREHARIALQGVFMYSLAYLCVYHAERHVPTGLVAVGYSASPLVNGIGAWLLWRSALTLRFVLGGVLCVARRDADLRARVHRR